MPLSAGSLQGSQKKKKRRRLWPLIISVGIQLQKVSVPAEYVNLATLQYLNSAIPHPIHLPKEKNSQESGDTEALYTCIYSLSFSVLWALIIIFKSVLLLFFFFWSSCNFKVICSLIHVFLLPTNSISKYFLSACFLPSTGIQTEMCFRDLT